ncbi:hypothetical protein [Microtetraspora malaysiensis]|uniref:Uncharacterized protein n=1 Tax=Microtetraspora malaysiensis TaxID=161358 RepID=A0ABW6SRB0_9ACTN
MPRRSFLPLAVLTLLAGCDTGTAAAPSATPSPTQNNAHTIQAIKADCMKGKGFRYVPWVRPAFTQSADDEKLASGDYEAEKAHRSKYGFNVAPLLVYRPGQETSKADNRAVDPNYATKRDLSPAQQQVYDTTAETCEAQAIKQVTGKVVKSAYDWYIQANVMISRRLKRDLDGDPELAELASDMADCMAAKGYRVSGTTPTAVSAWGETTFRKEMHELAQKEDKSIPAFDPEKQTAYLPHLTPAEARRLLDREIKAALDDLECGQRFYPAFRPKSNEVTQQVDAEFGLLRD